MDTKGWRWALGGRVPQRSSGNTHLSTGGEASCSTWVGWGEEPRALGQERLRAQHASTVLFPSWPTAPWNRLGGWARLRSTGVCGDKVGYSSRMEEEGQGCERLSSTYPVTGGVRCPLLGHPEPLSPFFQLWALSDSTGPTPPQAPLLWSPG